MIKKIVAVVLVAAALAALLYYSQVRFRPRKISGFLEADEIRLGSRVGGRVLKIHVAEGDRVKAAAPLVDLDPYDLLDLRAQAAATVQSRQADLDKLHAGGYAFQIETTFRARLAGARVKEVPITFEERRVGQSKMSMNIFLEAFLLVMALRLTSLLTRRRRTVQGRG